MSTSYAGGITKNGGEYDHARVAGTTNTLNGNVQGAYAGGLIGRADTGTTLNNAYSAASVYGATEANKLYTESAPNSVTEQGTVYGAGEYQQGTGPIKVGSPISPVAPATPSTGGKPYDAGLLDSNNPGNTLYPYIGLQDMNAGGDYEWIKNHVGDWPNIPDLTPTIALHNAEVLSVDVWLDDCDYSKVDLNITGPNGSSATIPFPFDSTTGKFIPGTSNRVFPKLDASGNPVINPADGKICYVVILGDVTRANLGFGDIPFDDPTNPIPLGSQIDVTAHAESLDGRIKDSNTESCNSLFADGSDPDNPDITNFRHLQNLSELNSDASHPAEATLKDNLDWNDFKQAVQDTHKSYTPSYNQANDTI